MKIMAVLNALRSPAFQAELGIAPSTGPSSPHDSYASESGSISSGMTGGSDDHYHDLAMPPPPPPPTSSQTRRSSEKDDNVCSSAMIHPTPAEIFCLFNQNMFTITANNFIFFDCLTFFLYEEVNNKNISIIFAVLVGKASRFQAAADLSC